MNKKILSLAALTIFTSLFSTNIVKTNAETPQPISYVNNAYQMCEVQSTTRNLYLGDSIYNYGLGHLRQNKSIRIKKPISNTLTFYFKFNNSLDTYKYSVGEFLLSVFNDDYSYVQKFSEQISSIEEIKEFVERHDNCEMRWDAQELFIQLDVSQGSDYLIIGGDEHSSTYEHFSLLLGTEELLIENFMLYDGTISSFHYQIPQYGMGAKSNKIYHNNDTISMTINYDNRLSIEEIKNNIVAFDYYDNIQINPTIVKDDYTAAINDNLLGAFNVTLNATDSSQNSTNLNLILRIEDTTGPIIEGSKSIEIHYTDLPEDNLIDLSQYITLKDNHDGIIELDDKYAQFSPQMFGSQNIVIEAEDQSGNKGGGTITLSITDKIAPVIEGADVLEVYQYELSSVNDLLSKYNIYDDGSGIYKKSVTGSKYSFTEPGTYEINITATDNTSNTTTKPVTLKVKDGVGPVFFVNVSSIIINTDTYKSADEVISLLMENNSINKAKYSKCEYITKSYKDNYNRVGKYDTQIVCYSDNGERDYYLVSINVQEPKNSNFFTRFYDSMINFFNNIAEFFRSIFNKMKSFFKKLF